MQDKDITPYNDNGQRHGYWEDYFDNGKLHFKGNYINGIRDGYWEDYWPNGNLAYKGNYKDGKEIGLWFENDKEYYYAQ